MTTRIVSLGALAAALALAACASTPTSTARAAATPAGCVRATGTRLPAPSGCSAFGNSYSQEDIARTGQTTAGAALELLDPNVRTH